MAKLRLHLGGNVIHSEDMPLEVCEGLAKALSYHAPFVRKDYAVEVVS